MNSDLTGGTLEVTWNQGLGTPGQQGGFTIVPAPGALALLGLAGIAGQDHPFALVALGHRDQPPGPVMGPAEDAQHPAGAGADALDDLAEILVILAGHRIDAGQQPVALAGRGALAGEDQDAGRGLVPVPVLGRGEQVPVGVRRAGERAGAGERRRRDGVLEDCDRVRLQRVHGDAVGADGRGRYVRANSSFAPAPGVLVAFATVLLSSSGGFKPQARALARQLLIVPSDVLSASRGAFFSRSRLSAAAFAAAFLRRSMRQRRWRPISAVQKASEATKSSFMSVARGHQKLLLTPSAHTRTCAKGPQSLSPRR